MFRKNGYSLPTLSIHKISLLAHLVFRLRDTGSFRSSIVWRDGCRQATLLSFSSKLDAIEGFARQWVSLCCACSSKGTPSIRVIPPYNMCGVVCSHAITASSFPRPGRVAYKTSSKTHSLLDGELESLCSSCINRCVLSIGSVSSCGFASSVTGGVRQSSEDVSLLPL